MRQLNLTLMLLALCGSAFAQTFDMDQNRVPLTSIDGSWRFHPGDDMRWANPKFDDSSWVLLRTDEPWTERGVSELGPFVWYRFKVSIPAKEVPAAMMLPQIVADYEVYVNGQKVRLSRGNRLDSAETLLPPSIPEVIPLEVTSSELTLHTFAIAIRVWTARGARRAIVGTGGFVGNRELITGRVRAAHATAVADWVDSTVAAAILSLLGLLVLGLFVLRKKDREYLWFAITLLTLAGTDLVNTLGYGFAWVSLQNTDVISGLLNDLSLAAAMLFFQSILVRRRDVIWWVCFLAAAVNTTVTAITLGVPFSDYVRANELRLIFELPGYCWILTMLIRRSASGDRDAQLLLVPTLANYGWSALLSMVNALAFKKWIPLATQAEFFRLGLNVGPWRFGLSALVDVIFGASLLAFLIRRFALSRQREERLAADVEAARQIQQILVPEENPVVRGFEIESVYLPAETVSGDFFQHIPDGHDGLLIITGDVAGKGLAAAMLVSVLVGAVRATARETNDPQKMLDVLNDCMQGRRGFATCLAVHIAANGLMRIANAGHIPPYLNGASMELPGSLPLGMAADSEYGVHEFRLNPGDLLRFVSDGVLEAQDAAGNLLGFERTRELSREKAQQIAKAAQEFGQKDDITVVAVDFLGVAHAAA